MNICDVYLLLFQGCNKMLDKSNLRVCFATQFEGTVSHSRKGLAVRT